MKRYIIILCLIVVVFIFGSMEVFSLERVNDFSITDSFMILDEPSIDSSLNTGMTKVISIIKYFYDILIILVPIALLLFGTIDLLKAVASQDEKAIKSAQSSLGRRIMWAFVALSAMLIFRLVMSVVAGGNAWRQYW